MRPVADVAPQSAFAYGGPIYPERSYLCYGTTAPVPMPRKMGQCLASSASTLGVALCRVALWIGALSVSTPEELFPAAAMEASSSNSKRQLKKGRQ